MSQSSKIYKVKFDHRVLTSSFFPGSLNSFGFLLPFLKFLLRLQKAKSTSTLKLDGFMSPKYLKFIMFADFSKSSAENY